jgi:hypothetical protein
VPDVALQAAREFDSKVDRAQALVEVAAKLPAKLRRQVLEEALRAARKTSSVEKHLQIQVVIASALPEAERRREVLDEALRTTRAVGDGKDRSQILSRLAIALAEEREAARARPVAESIEDEEERMQALMGLVPALPEGERRAVLEESLVAAGVINDKVAISEALAEMAAVFADAGQRREASSSHGGSNLETCGCPRSFA